MKQLIDSARADGESLGGVFVVTATGLVPGLGTYSEAERGSMLASRRRWSRFRQSRASRSEMALPLPAAGQRRARRDPLRDRARFHPPDQPRRWA